MEERFLAKPEQLEAKLEEWLSLNKAYMKIDYINTYSKHKVYAITITDFSVDNERKKTLFISQPHAHEPATTAGMIDIIEQLLTYRDLSGRETQIDVQKVLSNMILTLSPIGNPYGREHAPVVCWDGSKYSNNQFYCFMRGEDPDNSGQMWKRLGLFDIRKEKAPNPIGIVYEPIDEYRYVEPNRSQLSSYFRIFHKMSEIYEYKYWLELHQTEFVNSEYNCMILLPNEDKLVDSIQNENIRWASSVSRAWHKQGFSVAKPTPLGYTGREAAYFMENYSKVDRKFYRITSEVKNNALDFPAEKQLKANTCAIISSTNHILEK